MALMSSREPLLVKNRIETFDSSAVVRCAAELKQLLETQKLRPFRRWRARIVVELPWLPPEERERWSDILSKHFHGCGCGHGAAFLLAGGGLFLGHFVAHGFRPLGFWYLLVVPLVLIVLSGVGRAFGILWSRTRFRRSVERLLAMSHAAGPRHG